MNKRLSADLAYRLLEQARGTLNDWWQTEPSLEVSDAIWYIDWTQRIVRKVLISGESNETRSDTKSPAAHQT